MNKTLAKTFLGTLVLLFSLIPAKAQTAKLILGSWNLKKAFIEGRVDSSMRIILEFRKGGVLFGENATKKEVVDGTWKQTNLKQIVVTNNKVKKEVMHIVKLTKNELILTDENQARFYLERLNHKKLRKERKKLIRNKWEVTKWVKGKGLNFKKKSGVAIFDFKTDGVLRVEDKEKEKIIIARWRLLKSNQKMICTVVIKGRINVFTIENLTKRGLVMINSNSDKYHLKAK